MPFDPDSYLQEGQTHSDAFDPDAHLATGNVDEIPKAPKEGEGEPKDKNTHGVVRKGWFGINYVDPATVEVPHTAPQPTGADTPVGAVAGNLIGGTVGGVVGGYRGMADLATGKGLDTAVNDVQAAQDTYGYHPNGGASETTTKVMGSNYNPLNWPDLAGQKLGDWSAQAGFPAGVSTALRVAPDAAVMLWGSKKVPETRAAVEEGPIAPEGMPFEPPKPTVADKVLRTSRDAGYVVPPATSRPGVVSGLTEGLAGKQSVAQAASVKNQAVTNNLVRQDLGLPKDAPLIPETMAAIRAQEAPVYEAIKGAGEIKIDPTYHKELDGLLETQSKISKSFPNYKSGAAAQVQDLVSSLRPEGDVMDAEVAVELSKDLRFNANANYNAAARTGDPSLKALANAQKKAAGAIEDQVSRHLEEIGQPELAAQWDASRTRIAKSYTAEGALDGAGNVDAIKLGKLKIKGKPVTGGMAVAADFANTFPKAARVAPGKESLPGMSPLDVYGSVAASLGTGNPLPLLIGPGRMAARSLALSKVGQKLATPPVKVGAPRIPTVEAAQALEAAKQTTP